MPKPLPPPAKPLRFERPRVEPGSTVSFWIRESAHDQLLKLARDRRMTLSSYMASQVDRLLSR
jgi:hypothetical protein